jgi:hypothetical protein
MRNYIKLFLSMTVAFFLSVNSFAQTKVDKRVDSKQFFADESPVNVTITTDIAALQNKKTKEDYVKGIFNWKNPDGSEFNEEIRLHANGVFRRNYCYTPPLRLNFHNPTSPGLYKLNNIKLTCACKKGNYYDQLIFKEYLVNKIYNLITDKSFQVRLAYVTIADDKDKKKPITQYGFFTEDLKEMAKRNQCKALTTVKVSTEGTNRDHMTLVSLFQYMIGNTDWAVPVNHNIRLIVPKADSTANPYAIALDFDASGLVHADYANPDPQLGTETVLERVYRGFPRTMPELEKSLKIFTDKKEKIYSLIKNFTLLNSSNRSEMIDYLDEFYKDISDRKRIQELFIDNARTK